MKTSTQRRRNGYFWTGLLVLLAALLSNGLFFINVPGRQIAPWLNLLLPVFAVVLFVMGLRRAMTQPAVYRGNIAGWIFTVLSVLLLVLTAFGFYSSRHIPAVSAATPQVGQRAPDFTLSDNSNQPLSLTQLLAAPGAAGAPPKSVLLIFYRGYW
jgi:hypothetical protein